ncbi:hypothetical protein BVRB_7g180560 [Beta vulgaris subsp. vulgaris]|uniref:Uncharacterized protein n=1 Tax=Beta vulgaris subsp. vulgaris TaxID=3555 RepID=A0A0J8B6K5_BETVV|nr:hypothetical protein BVRB_7g180560 [Beta vulgaris subsp. vulgaris]
MAKKPGGGKAVAKKNKGPNVNSLAKKTKSVDELMGVGDLLIGENRIRIDDVEEIQTPDASLKEFIVVSAIKRTFSDWLTVISKKNEDRVEWEGNAAQSSRGNSHSPVPILQWNDELNDQLDNNVVPDVVEVKHREGRLIMRLKEARLKADRCSAEWFKAWQEPDECLTYNTKVTESSFQAGEEIALARMRKAWEPGMANL